MQGGIVELSAKEQQANSVDAIEEMRMRSWARRHYEPAAYRSSNLHPIILDEMRHKDQETTSASQFKTAGSQS